MTRFCVSSLLVLALFVSSVRSLQRSPFGPSDCGVVLCEVVDQSQRADTSLLTGTRLDVDINGNIILVDSDRNTVRLFSKALTRTAEIGGSGWGDDQFDHPAGIWARNGIDIFVADYGNHRIQRFDRKLAFISSFSTRDRSNPDERFGYPTDVAVSRLGDLFICDSENSRILKVIGLSKIAKTFGGFDAGKGRLHKPNQLEIGPNDNVYVQDGKRVVVFDNFGNFIRVIGEGLFQTNVQIFSDEYGLTVLDNRKLFFFDINDRLVFDTQLDSLLKTQQSNVRAFVFSRGVGYFVTSQGILTATDPRAMQSNQITK